MKRLKVTIGILLIFVLGALAGSLGTGLCIKHEIKEFAKGGPPPLMHLLMRRMSHKLDLTETQEIEIKKIVEETHKKMSDFRERYHPEFEKIIDNSFALIKEKLNDEQKTKLDELHGELKKRKGPRRPPRIRQLRGLHKMPEQLLASMKQRLNLTQEQEKKARLIIDESIEKRRDVIKQQRERDRLNRVSMRKELQAIQQTTEQQLETVLTEEQMEEYRKIQEERPQEIFPGRPEPHPRDFMGP